jgi:hypothetical protein
MRGKPIFLGYYVANIRSEAEGSISLSAEMDAEYTFFGPGLYVSHDITAANDVAMKYNELNGGLKDYMKEPGAIVDLWRPG